MRKYSNDEYCARKKFNNAKFIFISMETVEHLKRFVEQCGSNKSAAERLNLAPSQITDYIKGRRNPGAKVREKLRDAGYIFNDERGWAAVRNLPPMMRVEESPEILIPMMLSRVAAGEPIDGFDGIDAYFNPAKFFKPTSKLIQSTGESMIGAGITEGDWLLVDTIAEQKNGQIVTARIGDKLTVKRLKMNGDHWLLNPENPNFEPIRIDDKDTEVLGVVVWSGRFHR